MSEQYYIYWHKGDPKPDKRPDKCEVWVHHFNGWADEHGNPDHWEDDDPRRWPVTESEWRTHHYCQAYGITVPEGWRVVDFRSPVADEMTLRTDGTMRGGHSGLIAMPILERIEEWITPTDEDAKRRPMVQVRCDTYEDKWRDVTLIAVEEHTLDDDDYDFAVIENGIVEFYNQCRMKKVNA